MKPSATVWLRFEGLAAFASAIAVYHHYGHSWTWFAVLFLAPDVSMLGYASGPRVGAWAYNLAHTYVLALGLTAGGALTGHQPTFALGLIWCAHIGFDRALGYGLKLPAGFRETHLGRIGRDREAQA